MSTRTYLPPDPVIKNGDMSGNIVSDATILRSLSKCSYGLSWVGTSPVGTASVQCSNDYSLNPDGSVKNVGTWNTMTFLYNGSLVSSVAISGNSENGMFDIFDTGIYAIRLIYTFGSGVGTLQAIIAGKVS